MLKVKQIFKDVLKGKLLVDENAEKNWGFLIFLAALALLMITSSHQVDKKVQLIAQLNKQKRELRSQYVSTKSDLMKLKMESSITKRLEENGLFASQIPPQKIKANITK